MSWHSASNVAWLRGLPGVREKEPLASRTSFGIGGPADFFIEPAKADGIEKVQADLRRFQEAHHLDQVVVVNVASTEPAVVKLRSLRKMYGKSLRASSSMKLTRSGGYSGSSRLTVRIPAAAALICSWDTRIKG